MRKHIPKFKDEKAEADFWDKNSSIDHLDELKDAKGELEFDPALIEKALKMKKERKSAVTLRMAPSQIKLAKIIAGRYHDGCYQALMRVWIRKGIKAELAAHPDIVKDITRKPAEA